MQRFIADDGFWEIFPEAEIAVLSLSGVREGAVIPQDQRDEIVRMLADANETAKKYVTEDPVSANEVPHVWRQAFMRFPTKKGAYCSIESLLKRVHKGRPVGPVVPSVDIANSVSLKYAFPTGNDDLDRVQGDMHLGLANGGEYFVSFGSDHDDPPAPGELIYYDSFGAICRCWNWRGCKRTSIDEESSNEIIFLESVQPERRAELEAAQSELATLMEKYLGAQIEAKAVLTKDSRELVVRR